MRNARLFPIWRGLARPGLWRAWAWAWVCLLAGQAAAATAVEPLVLFNREVAELRAVLGGLSPAERAVRAQRRFAALSPEESAAPLRLQALDSGSQRGVTLMVGDKPIFTLLEADLDPEEHLNLWSAAEQAQRRLHAALAARAAQSAPAQWMRGGATALAVLAGWALLVWAASRVQRALQPVPIDPAGPPRRLGPAAYARLIARRMTSAAVWLIVAALLFAGLVLWLEAFPWSQPWADRLLENVRLLGGWLVGGTLAAVPGLLTVLLVMVVARGAQDALRVFMDQVQTGVLRVPFVHADTAGATRRLLNVLLWGVALAVAYPFLPGSGSDAFKGLSVLLGLMVTLGSTGVMTQLMSGLVVVYSRSLKRGDFVTVNGIEGVVDEVGALAVKIKTMRNEEVTVPNAVITGSPIHNYSQRAGDLGTLLSTRVTIGYDTPWRQVHALLIEAALAAPGLRDTPAPFVYQRALSDFYVEYELFAYIDRPLERVPILSGLHQCIQDAFNRHGVQIMSPHFIDQPAQPVVVPPARWYAAPAQPVGE